MIAHGGLIHLLEVAALPFALSSTGLVLLSYRIRARRRTATEVRPASVSKATSASRH